MILTSISYDGDKLTAEFEQGNAERPYFLVQVDVEQDDLEEFAQVIYDGDYIVEDKYDYFRPEEFSAWLDSADRIKIEYCKQLPQYAAAQICDAATVVGMTPAIPA